MLHGRECLYASFDCHSAYACSAALHRMLCSVLWSAAHVHVNRCTLRSVRVQVFMLMSTDERALAVCAHACVNVLRLHCGLCCVICTCTPAHMHLFEGVCACMRARECR
jgi:hypothetical protein